MYHISISRISDNSYAVLSSSIHVLQHFRYSRVYICKCPKSCILKNAVVNLTHATLNMAEQKLYAGEYLASSVKRMEADGVLVLDTRYSEPVFEGWHAHANAHFSLAVEGGTREERSKSTYDVLPGRVNAYHSGELHRNRNTVHPSRNFCVELESGFLKRYGIRFPDPHKIMNHPDASLCMINIFRESANAVHQSSGIVHEWVLRLLSIHINDRMTEVPSWAIKAKELIHDSWCQNISLEEISRITGVHPITISRYFPRYFRYTVGDYTRMVKVQKAAVMMKSTDINLTAIAQDCGFFDQSHFIRVFRKFTGYSPLQYKKA